MATLADLLVLNPKKARACHHLQQAPQPALTSSLTTQGEPVDLVTPLKAYIDAKFAGGYAADAAEDLSVIQALRAEVVANALVSPDARRDLLLRCAHRKSHSTGLNLCHTG